MNRLVELGTMRVLISGQSSGQKISRVKNIVELKGTLALRRFNPSLSAGFSSPLEKQPSGLSIPVLVGPSKSHKLWEESPVGHE
jgi:hypothetical protein